MMRRRPKMNESLFQVADKSFVFAVELVGLYETLGVNKTRFQSKQLFRYGTQIGAKVVRSGVDFTRQGFIDCFSIAHRRAFETKYWLDAVYDSGYINREDYERFEARLYVLCRDMDIFLKKIRLNKAILNLKRSRITDKKLLQYYYN
jgi:four helix bundle protein